MLDLNDIDENFPFAEMRDNQRDAIVNILNTFNSGKKFAIMEGPTGSGKSAIGICLANYFDSVYYITPQKILQDQLIRDFSDQGAVELKGRSSYPCVYYHTFDQAETARRIGSAKLQKELISNPTCDTGFCKKHLNKSGCKKCLPDLEALKNRQPVRADLPVGNLYSVCPYFEQLFRTRDAHIAVMNFSSFLCQTDKAHFSQPRDLLIIDEAHNTEKELLNFVSFMISDRVIDIPDFEFFQQYLDYFDEQQLGTKIAELVDQNTQNCDYKLASYYNNLLERYNQFRINADSDWVFVKDEGTITFKPVYANAFANKLLFSKGAFVLLMSATILDPQMFARTLNISKTESTSFRMANRFPVENRPIYIDPAAKIVGGKSQQHIWEPKLIAKIDHIMGLHKNERGIIHSHNFAISNAVCKKSKYKNRLFFQNDYDNKDDMLFEHSKSLNGVIIAPAMHEGLDLKDDLSRFQIITKVPWPNFFDDPQLKIRVDEDPSYLNWLTALKLCQSVGRSVRSETDWAKTYIIDEGIKNFINSNSHILPSWFKEALIYV